MTAIDPRPPSLHDVLTAGTDPEARFAQATGEAQRLLDGYNAYCRGERSRGVIRVG